jgi:hypothetical protein
VLGGWPPTRRRDVAGLNGGEWEVVSLCVFNVLVLQYSSILLPSSRSTLRSTIFDYYTDSHNAIQLVFSHKVYLTCSLLSRQSSRDATQNYKSMTWSFSIESKTFRKIVNAAVQLPLVYSGSGWIMADCLGRFKSAQSALKCPEAFFCFVY